MPLLEDLENMEEGKESGRKPKIKYPPIIVDVERKDDSGKGSGKVNFPVQGDMKRNRNATTDDLFLA